MGMKGGDHWTTGSPINMILMEAEGLLWREVSAGGAGSAGRQQTALTAHSRKTGRSFQILTSVSQCGWQTWLNNKKISIKCLQVPFSIFRSRLPSSLLFMMCWPSTCCRLGILAVVSSWDSAGIWIEKLQALHPWEDESTDGFCNGIMSSVCVCPAAHFGSKWAPQIQSEKSRSPGNLLVSPQCNYVTL